MSFWECWNMVCSVLNNNCRTIIRFVVNENFNETESCTKFRGEISMCYRCKELVFRCCSKVKVIIVLYGKVSNF